MNDWHPVLDYNPIWGRCRKRPRLSMKHNNTLLQQFNDGLLGMRELFHNSGRLEDSNAKLEEISKLLCLEIASVRDPNSQVPGLKEILAGRSGDRHLVSRLNRALSLASKSRILVNYDGESLLGPNPKFNIADSEIDLARGLAQIVLDSFNGHLRESEASDSFEFLNEAFSHFIRDNFRQNIEDAQYMTPPEVVNFMVDLGIARLKKRRFSLNNPPIVCDPSCGVGSFLAQFYRIWTASNKKRVEPILIGQDKVDRMARLSLLNLALFGIEDPQVFRGNSLQADSPLDSYSNRCDLILTNPPFGARFKCSELAQYSSAYFPMLNGVIQKKRGLVDSELLFLDRYFSLLKPGGTMLAVLPDSVISAAGLPAQLRAKIQQNWTIKSITELPAVTFAQAGTRTKTSILEIEKRKPTQRATVMSNAHSLGFEVSSKKGVAYKKSEGENTLAPLLKSISTFSPSKPTTDRFVVLSDSPSSVAVAHRVLFEEGWTPSHYSSERLNTLQKISRLDIQKGYEVRTLGSLVEIAPKGGRWLPESESQKCISVLHVGDFGSLNVRELMQYAPKTAGKPCMAGDLLFSKINPRIPRALVVPELPFDLTCSPEFEVMRPLPGFTAHEIMLLLLSDFAQDQVLSLTSGTSSSHNRIKTKELLSIRLALPTPKSKHRAAYSKAVQSFTAANIRLNDANATLQASWDSLNKSFSHQ